MRHEEGEGGEAVSEAKGTREVGRGRGRGQDEQSMMTALYGSVHDPSSGWGDEEAKGGGGGAGERAWSYSAEAPVLEIGMEVMNLKSGKTTATSKKRGGQRRVSKVKW